MEKTRIHLRMVPATVHEGREYSAKHDYYIETRPDVPDRLFLICEYVTAVGNVQVFVENPIYHEDLGVMVEAALTHKKNAEKMEQKTRFYLRTVDVPKDDWCAGYNTERKWDYYIETRPEVPDRLMLIREDRGTVRSFGQTPIFHEDLAMMLGVALGHKQEERVVEDKEAEEKLEEKAATKKAEESLVQALFSVSALPWSYERKQCVVNAIREAVKCWNNE
jgi:hypothetical protein